MVAIIKRTDFKKHLLLKLCNGGQELGVSSESRTGITGGNWKQTCGETRYLTSVAKYGNKTVSYV